MTIGAKLKQLRTDKGLSQVEVAEKACISKQTLYKYENDIISNIPLENIARIAKVLEVAPAFIMGWEDEKPESNSSTIRAMRYYEKLCNLSEENRKLVEQMIDTLSKKD